MCCKGGIKINILSFYIGLHDSNLCIIRNGKVTYFKSERIFQYKHKKSSIDWILEVCSQMNFVPDIICFSDGNRNNLGTCSPTKLYEEVNAITEFPNAVKTYCVDHHYAHILSSWMINKSTNAKYGISIDGRGDNNTRISIISNPFNIKDSKIIFQSSNYQYCMFFQELGKIMKLNGLQWDYAGKIMGMQAYGEINYNLIEIYKNKGFSKYPLKILKRKYNDIYINELYENNIVLFREWLASVHKFIGDSIEEIFESFFEKNDIIIYSGGCAQNTVINAELCSKYSNIVIPPHCYDGGLSLGCAYLAAYLNDESIAIDGFPFCNSLFDVGYATKETLEFLAELLSNNKIIGFAQGISEIGPRALGHRSILMNPQMLNGKQLLNERIKKREYWRPFAASILKENLPLFTPSIADYPFMLHTVKTFKKCSDIYPSIIHKDKTCRFQTVGYEKELLSYRILLEIMQSKYNIHALLNTSLNANGFPIALTYDDCFKVFNDTQLDAICIGNNIYTR